MTSKPLAFSNGCDGKSGGDNGCPDADAADAMGEDDENIEENFPRPWLVYCYRGCH